MFKGGNQIIGQGTHGIIFVDSNDINIVIKKYNKMTIKCCDKLQNEFYMQKYLHEIFENDDIYVPNCCCFTEMQNECSYKMERIFELTDKNFRKIDENTIETKILSNINKFAWFLYSAMTSMSLIPNNTTLLEKFIEGYKIYKNNNNNLHNDVFNEIINIIYEYQY